MEDELRLSLLFAGTCFIIAVLAHGIWKIRKQKAQQKPRIEPGDWESSDEQNVDDDWQYTDSPNDFDELGLGKVRVVGKNASSKHDADDDWQDDVSEPPVATPRDKQEPDENREPEKSEVKPQPAPEKAVSKPLYGAVVSNPKPHLKVVGNAPEQASEDDFGEPPGFLLNTGEEPSGNAGAEQAQPKEDFSLDAPSSEAQAASKPSSAQGEENSGMAEQAKRFVAKKRSKISPKKRQEPSFGDDQMRIDFDDREVPQEQTSATQSDADSSAPAEQEVLIINVRAPEEETISGAALLPMLLTLGFKFGDQDIFHRHVNSNGKGPVLFSLANMFKPGVFDIDNLETFSTRGVSLFMILPIEGDPHQVFNMMHNAARKIADEFNAQVLDGRRSVLTKQGLQQYVEKIREFERKRMISRQ